MQSLHMWRWTPSFFKTQTNKSRPSMNNGYQCVLIEHELAIECRTDGTDTSPFNHTRHFLCILNNVFLSSHDPISSKMGLILFFFLCYCLYICLWESSFQIMHVRIVVHIKKRQWYIIIVLVNNLSSIFFLYF